MKIDMANHLDLEEQEQLDQLKHFWKQYGNLITGVLILVLGALAAWNGYQYWQQKQATQAAAMFDEVEKVVRSGDVAQAERAFDDMKQRFGSAVYTPQAGLLVAKMAYLSSKPEVAQNVLGWVAESKADEGYAAIAKLRLAGMRLEAKAYDEALKLLEGTFPAEFASLVADRRGDVLAAQGKNTEAIALYQKAYLGFDAQSEYRRMVLVKLNALGATAGDAT
ncbi:putative negative regulator of RcsB-dependent stress response [Rhodoferax saidenbachensis]|uniref:Ancillary SecYEG translocon subunit n=2 Tax=Rhodoferax saidenbachensis TaxID=1484693 RepID=A0ABU1ZIU8_9BURK|nr:putative negative regulator of RcsB-dependent stress response [Rhodoferax saidenbachensis]